MLNDHKVNYPREPYSEEASPIVKVKCPVVTTHGLKDRYSLTGALNDNWNWLERDLTLVTIPDGFSAFKRRHFVLDDTSPVS